jgi:hypothetical protein
MRINRKRAHRPLALIGAMTCAILLLSACGASGGASSGGEPTLACTTTTSVQGIDVISTLLTCTVANAPAGDTSFTLTYAVTNTQGGTHSFDLPCQGALSHGAGVCTQRYSVIVPLAAGKASVAGKTAPSQRQLGPVIPQSQPATSTTLGPLTLAPGLP